MKTSFSHYMAPKKKGSIKDAIIPGYRVRIKPDAWHAMNRNKLQEWVTESFKKSTSPKRSVSSSIESSPPDTCALFHHQHIIKDFMQPESPYRGLMLYHSLGSGKTRGSISIAEVLSSNYKVIVMVPASLASNYIEEIRKCGNELYRTTGKWTFIPKASKIEYAQASRHAIDQGVAEATIKQNVGVWMREPVMISNYDGLSDMEQAQINSQVEDMIRARYNFIHYNGLNKKKILEMQASSPEGTTPFDNHLVIIDEVHNLVSRIVNNRPIARTLYNMMLSAKNSKIILLSGTPIINKPVELGVIANMVRGYTPHFTVTASGVNSDQWKSIETFLRENKRVDYYELDSIKSKLTVYPVTQGFEWADKDAFLIRRSYDEQPRMLREDIEVFMRTINVRPRSIKVADKVTRLLPDDEKDFDSLFIDYSALDKNSSPVLNHGMLSRRLQGIVSYYESFDKAQFPSVSETNIIKVPMSDEVFKTYMSVRQEEFEKEMKAKMNRRRPTGNEINAGNIYRAFSRALCNYSFPSSIKRPYPSNVAKLKLDGMEDDALDMDASGSEADTDDDHDLDDETPSQRLRRDKRNLTTNKNKVMRMYIEQLKAAMNELKRNSESYLQGDGLEQYGPKYAQILERIQTSPGHTLLYSQFRNVEGHGIMMLVLQSAGFTEFVLEKNEAGEWITNMTRNDWEKQKYAIFSGDKERSKLLMAIYNNDFTALPPKLHKKLKELNQGEALTNLRGEILKVMMITQSGAEGISLKNVRQVHIMEPYWNEIRVKQVIGRAVRAGSHLTLPEDERHVDVFMYQTVFSDKQLKNATVISREGARTSDEYIFNIAQKKSRITNQLLDIVKSSAIDCLVHRETHKNAVKCARYPSNFGEPIRGVLYSYRGANEDPSDDTINKQIRDCISSRHIGFVRCSKSDGTGMRVPYYKDTMEALHPVRFAQTDGEEKVVIGRIVLLEDGSPKVVVFHE